MNRALASGTDDVRARARRNTASGCSARASFRICWRPRRGSAADRCGARKKESAPDRSNRARATSETLSEARRSTPIPPGTGWSRPSQQQDVSEPVTPHGLGKPSSLSSNLGIADGVEPSEPVRFVGAGPERRVAGPEPPALVVQPPVLERSYNRGSGSFRKLRALNVDGGRGVSRAVESIVSSFCLVLRLVTPIRCRFPIV